MRAISALWLVWCVVLLMAPGAVVGDDSRTASSEQKIGSETRPLEQADSPQNRAAAPSALAQELGPAPGWDAQLISPLLSLSSEQRQKLQDLVRSVRNDVQVLIAGVQQLSRAQQQVQLPALRQRMELVIQSYRRRLEDVLTPAQNQRLREISLQIRGLAAINDPDVAEQLKLSDQQRAGIAAAIDEAALVRREMLQAPRPANRFERKDRRLAMRQTKQQLEARLSELLSPEQQDEFARMQGPKLGLNDLLQLQGNMASAAPPPTETDEPKVDLGEPKK